MNTKQLHYFIVTAEKQSIAAAAKALDIAAPAISHQLGSLEHELKTTLFVRNHKGVTLTPSGYRFLAHAQQVLQKIDFAKRDLDHYNASQSGLITIGMNEAIGNVLAMTLIDAMAEELPNISLDLRTGTTYRLNKWLCKNKIDVAITYKQLDGSSHISSETLMQESLFLVVSKEDPQGKYAELLERDTIEFWRLANYDLITLNSRDSASELLRQTADKAGISLRFSVPYSGQLVTNVRYVAQGKGAIVLPSSATYHLQQREVVHCLKIISPEITRNVVALYANESSKQVQVSQALALIKRKVVEAHQQGIWKGTLAI